MYNMIRVCMKKRIEKAPFFIKPILP